jgi:acyl dehydratase
MALYFEDFKVGFEFETNERELTEEAIIAFAKVWDPQPFHIDHTAAAQTPYGGIIASGWHTLLTGFILTLELGVFNACSLGSPGMDEVRWIRPVRPGDRLRLRGRVLTARASKSKPDRGFLEVFYETLDHHGHVVSSHKATHICKVRPT